MPDEPEALGLLSLMLLHDARRAARVDGAGDLVTLEEQDRALWDADAIHEACKILDAAVRLRLPGPYQPGGDRRLPRPSANRCGHRLAGDSRALHTAE
jgi:predicted RNA polymerase sigma factor